jgi:excisionase family DNA binding protein
MNLLTVPEVAQILRVPPARAYDLARREEIPVVRLGRQIRVEEESLRAWIAGGGCGLTGRGKQRAA